MRGCGDGSGRRVGVGGDSSRKGGKKSGRGGGEGAGQKEEARVRS